MIDAATGDAGTPERADDQLAGLQVTPWVITGAYVLLGLTGLYFSDYFLPTLFSAPFLAEIQAWKGAAEIGVTAVVIFLLSDHSQTQIQESKERIQRQREELAVLHRVMRHNLRNDMNVVWGQADLIEETGGQAFRDHCETIKAKANDAIRYAEQANRIGRVSSVGRTTVDLGEKLEQIVHEHSLIDDMVAVRIDVERGLDVTVNKQFDQAVKEILTNAVRQGDADTLEIDIRAEEHPELDDFVSLEIADNGPGFPPDVQQVINDREHSQLVHLDGLGLWFAHWTAAESGGGLKIGTREQGGSVVAMHLSEA